MTNDLNNKTMLMRVDPLIWAKYFIDDMTEADKALKLLSNAYYKNMFAKLAYNNAIINGNVFHSDVQNNLENYSACTYPVNNNDVSNNWMLSGCIGKVTDNILKIASIFGTTAYIGGLSTGIISGIGASSAYCFTGGYDGSPMDDNTVKITGEEYGKGTVTPQSINDYYYK